MCIFSGEIEQVSGTQIFARFLPDGRQALIYSMSVIAPSEVAMVLPLPVAPGTAEIEFFDLAIYPELFSDLAETFVKTVMFGLEDELSLFDDAGSTLVVHEVGAFNASFVPKRGDFSRLDKRFRIPERVFTSVPAYTDFGFAVFQLRADEYLQDVHPMALAFHTRASNALYFPTLHVHDGSTVPPTAQFDHVLYAQGRTSKTWELSDSFVGKHVDLGRTKSLLVDERASRRTMQGTFVNEDVWL